MKHLIALLLLFITCQSLSGNPKDSVKLNITDFDFLTSTTEDNYVVYPQIINNGFNKEYKCMKSAIRNKLKKRQMGIEQAACEYAFWFFDKFDAHFHVDIPMFWNVYFPKTHIRYRELFTYEPKAISCMVDGNTWLIRVPSCEGKDPTFEWVATAIENYLNSGCGNLIIDLRGNTGGNDVIWEPGLPLLVDNTNITPDTIWFRNTKVNLDFFKQQLTAQPENEWLKSFIAKCETTSDEFVPINVGGEDDDEEELPQSEFPHRTAIIIDRLTGSSAETLVAVAKRYCNSERTKIFGKENTWGANETGNQKGAMLPNSKIWFYYPTCGNISFFQGNNLGSVGLAPNIRITLPYPTKLTDNIDEWVIWIASEMKKPSW